MKRIFLFSVLLMLSSSTIIFGQEGTKVKVDSIVSALNAKDAGKLLGMMTSGAGIGDLEDVDNKLVLPAILKNFSSIRSYVIISDDLLANGNRLVSLSVSYGDDKKGKPTLTFNREGKLLNLGIIRSRKRVNAELALKDALSAATRPDTLSVPFKLANGLIYVAAELNGINGYFLFDSGSPVTLLNKRFTEQDKQVRGVSFDFMGMGGKMDSLVWSQGNMLHWAGSIVPNLDAPASDMGDRELPGGLNYLGLLGYGMFSDYQLTFDYQRQLLLFEKVDSLGKLIQRPMYKGRLVAKAAMNMTRHIPVVTLLIAGNTYRMGLDCGANANVMQTSVRKDIGKSFDVEEEGVAINGVGSASESATSGYVMGASIGSLRFEDMFTVLTNQSIGAGSGEQSLGVVGLLGTPFLNQHRTTLNFKEGTISFYK